MVEGYFILNAKIVNEGKVFEGSVLIEDGVILDVIPAGGSSDLLLDVENVRIIDARGKYLLPGVIDDQVHFREPGLTHKGDIHSESRAAAAGGVTSFMDMPNTNPKATTLEVLEEKYKLASTKSLINYSFFLGATNDNLEEIKKANPRRICGLKVFMGASTGNMLVDDPVTLERIFAESPMLIAVHAEEESIVQENLRKAKERYGDAIPVEEHPYIRSEEACYRSSEKAVKLASKHNARLHLLHLSTAKELDLLTNQIPLAQKRITGEVCVHHLWFDEKDYATLGAKIKWNPSIKTEKDKIGLLAGVLDDRIDIIATDHAPHLLEEKAIPYTSSPSGAPLIQHSLVMMLELVHQKKITLQKVVEKMSHAPAQLYRIKNRGYIRKGFAADLVLVDLKDEWKATKETILYKCGWAPVEDVTFKSKVTHTFVNGVLVYENGKIREGKWGKRLEFVV